MNERQVKVSLNKQELEGLCLMCDKQLDGADRAIRFLAEDDTSYNSFEKMKLETVRKAWAETHRKIIAALEVITTIDSNNEEPENGDAKIVHHIARAD